MGHEDILGDEELLLQKHGGEGGECHRWTLNDHDYITRVQYVYDWYDGYVNKVEFTTKQGQYRSVGRGDGPFVAYYYSNEKQFVGFLSYEIDDETFSFGAYDSVCNLISRDPSELTEGTNSEIDALVEDYLKDYEGIITEAKVNELKEILKGPTDDSAQPENP